MPNANIKELLRKKRIYQWEIAAKLNVSEITFCRWLRQDLPEEKQRLIRKAIDEIAAERTEL